MPKNDPRLPAGKASHAGLSVPATTGVQTIGKDSFLRGGTPVKFTALISHSDSFAIRHTSSGIEVIPGKIPTGVLINEGSSLQREEKLKILGINSVTQDDLVNQAAPVNSLAWLTASSAHGTNEIDLARVGKTIKPKVLTLNPKHIDIEALPDDTQGVLRVLNGILRDKQDHIREIARAEFGREITGIEPTVIALKILPEILCDLTKDYPKGRDAVINLHEGERDYFVFAVNSKVSGPHAHLIELGRVSANLDNCQTISELALQTASQIKILSTKGILQTQGKFSPCTLIFLPADSIEFSLHSSRLTNAIGKALQTRY